MIKLMKINEIMYKFLIETYEKKPFYNDFFYLTLSYYVKKNDFNTVKEILEKTNWKTERNYHTLKFCTLSHCSLYKKPSYKLFELLFSEIIYQDPPESYGYKITKDDIKKYDLYKVIENCISTNKTGFLNKILKNYSYLNLIEHTLDYSIKLHNNHLCKTYYEANKSASLTEEIIRSSIKYKNVFMFQYISVDNNPFNRYSKWQAEKYPENIKEHYYIDTQRYIQVMEINHHIADDIVTQHINPKQFCNVIKELLDKNRNKTAIKWIEKLHLNKLSFSFKEIDISRDIRIDINKLSLKSLIIYNNLYKAQKVFEQAPLLSDFKFTNNLNNKIIRAISHNKRGYLNRIKEDFNLEKILFNSFLVDEYYSQISPISIKLPHELLPLNLNKKIELCLSNKTNTYLIHILKEHPWEELSKVCDDLKVSNNDTKHLLYHYMNNVLSDKPITKKIKI